MRQRPRTKTTPPRPLLQSWLTDLAFAFASAWGPIPASGDTAETAQGTSIEKRR